MEQRYSRLLAKCHRAMDSGNTTSAQLAFNKVVREYPDNFDTTLARARLCFMTGDSISGTALLYGLTRQSVQNHDINSTQLIAELKRTELYFPLRSILLARHHSGDLPTSNLVELASLLLQTGDVHQALEHLESYTNHSPLNATAALLRGHAYKALSNTAQAADAYHQYIKLAPAMSGSGYWSLADLKAYSFTHDDIEEMKQCNLDNDYQQGLVKLALHHAYAQHNQAEAALELLVNAKDLLHNYRKLHRPGFESLINKLLNSEPSVAATIEGTHQSPQRTPIFIVGLPRSGTTLTEQILAAHNQVASTDELAYIERIALYLSQKGTYPLTKNGLPEQEILRLRDFYFSQVEQYPLGNTTHFIDKNPNNILHVGLINYLFPEAIVLCLSRPVTDNAVSLYRQHFSKGNDYAYSPNDIAHYISRFYLLANHWLSVSENAMHVVNYENLVHQPETEIRHIVATCGLEFEANCLQFHTATSPVLTPSASQVRRPITPSSLGSGTLFKGVFENSEISLLTLEQQRSALLLKCNSELKVG